MPIDLSVLQARIKTWNDREFGPNVPSYFSLIKTMEELGELAGHYIKRIEHREGTPIEDHNKGVKDSVADIIIALTIFCIREGISLDYEVHRVWEEVSKRSFQFYANDVL